VYVKDFLSYHKGHKNLTLLRILTLVILLSLIKKVVWFEKFFSRVGFS